MDKSLAPPGYRSKLDLILAPLYLLQSLELCSHWVHRPDKEKHFQLLGWMRG